MLKAVRIFLKGESTMNELVIIKGKELFTNSLVIADGTQNEHKSVIRIIDVYKEKFERWGEIRFSDLKSTNPLGGRPTTVAYLNEQQATFLVTLLKNNDIVVNFKAELVDQFYKMREVINNWKNPEWQEIRHEVKLTFRKLTDAIKEVIIPLARAKGSTTPDDRFYISWSKMLCTVGCYSPKSREKLSIGHMFILHQLEDLAVAQIRGLAAMEFVDYKAIYRQTKIKLNTFAKIAMINERYSTKLLEG